MARLEELLRGTAVFVAGEEGSVGGGRLPSAQGLQVHMGMETNSEDTATAGDEMSEGGFRLQFEDVGFLSGLWGSSLGRPAGTAETRSPPRFRFPRFLRLPHPLGYDVGGRERVRRRLQHLGAKRDPPLPPFPQGAGSSISSTDLVLP